MKLLEDYKGYIFLGGGVLDERLYCQLDSIEDKLIGVFDLLNDDSRRLQSFHNYTIRNIQDMMDELNDPDNAIIVAIGHISVCKVVDKLVSSYPSFKDRIFVVNPYSSLRFYILEDDFVADKRIPFDDIRYLEVKDMFNDDESIRHFDLLVNSKPFENINDTYELISYSSVDSMYYYDENYWATLDFGETSDGIATVIDCGAYIGDSVESIVSVIPQKYVNYYALEPLHVNVQKMLADEDLNKLCNSFNVLEYGVGEKNETMYFHIPDSSSSDGGYFSSDPNGAAGRFVVRSIDTLDININGVLYIKMDVEGYELAALKGATNTIRNHHPFLAICLYHRKNDLVDIPLYIKSLGVEYDYYLRGGYHTILWAIPK